MRGASQGLPPLVHRASSQTALDIELLRWATVLLNHRLGYTDLLPPAHEPEGWCCTLGSVPLKGQASLGSKLAHSLLLNDVKQRSKCLPDRKQSAFREGD